jgi:hypothetical protein
MSQNVSSNVLFHFTKSVVAMKGILKDGFAPHYCLEYSLDEADKNAAAKGSSPLRAAPMVCFCDLPMSLIERHLREYGNFGIGLKKSWGLQNGVAPVIYTHSKAKTRPPISRLTSKALNEGDSSAQRDADFLAAYSKPFEGPAWRNNRVQKKVRFYDEREWRYVPVIRGTEPLFLAKNDYDNTSKRNAIHQTLKKKHALPITPNIIQYLILPYHKDEKNVLELHDYLMRLYGRRYGRKAAVLVATTIMTDDCIKEDF